MTTVTSASTLTATQTTTQTATSTSTVTLSTRTGIQTSTQTAAQTATQTGSGTNPGTVTQTASLTYAETETYPLNTALEITAFVPPQVVPLERQYFQVGLTVKNLGDQTTNTSSWFLTGQSSDPTADSAGVAPLLSCSPLTQGEVIPPNQSVQLTYQCIANWAFSAPASLWNTISSGLKNLLVEAITAAGTQGVINYIRTKLSPIEFQVFQLALGYLQGKLNSSVAGVALLSSNNWITPAVQFNLGLFSLSGQGFQITSDVASNLTVVAPQFKINQAIQFVQWQTVANTAASVANDSWGSRLSHCVQHSSVA